MIHPLPFKAPALAAFMATLLLGPAAAQSSNENSPPSRGSVLTVHGAGSFEQKPDYGRFEVSLVTQDKTLEATVSAHEERAGSAIEVLRRFEQAGVKIERSRFRLDEDQSGGYQPPQYPGHRPPPPKKSATPFTATTTFILKANGIDQLNATMSRIAETGLLRVQSVTFKVENERAALLEARRAAMLDARQQAKVYAEAADVTLVEINAITDGEASPSEVGEADMPRSLRRIQIVPPATISFNATVNVTWRISPR